MVEQFSFAEGVAKIEHKHTLIFHRMTWMISLEAFLLASYFVCRYSTVRCQTAEIDFLLYMIVFSGIVSTSIFYTSVLAAFRAIGNWRSMCRPEDKQKLTSRFFIHFLGDAPPAITGPLIFSVWVAIIFSDYAIIKNVSTLDFYSPKFVINFTTLVYLLTAILIFKKNSSR